MDDWIGSKEAAEILHVSQSTVTRSLKDDATADHFWGREHWRLRPLSERRIPQVLRSRAVELYADRHREGYDFEAGDAPLDEDQNG